MKKICEQAPLYFYGELDKEQAAAFKAHLTDCPACQREIAFMQQTQAALVSPAAPQAVVESVLRKPQELPFWRRVYKPVLAAALVVCLGVWGFMGRATLQNDMDVNEGWLAYVSEDIDADYYDFLTDFEAFEAEF